MFDEQILCKLIEKLPNNKLVSSFSSTTSSSSSPLSDFDHDNDIFAQTINSFKRLESIQSEHESINSDNLIENFFAKLRYDVEMHHEQSIEEINKHQQEIFDKLNQLERECKLNALHLEKLNLSDDFVSIKNELINEKNLIDLNNKIKQNIQLIQNDMIRFKNKCFMNKDIKFSPIKIKHGNLLGDLQIGLKISPNFGQIIRKIAAHSESVWSIQVDENMNRFVSSSQDNTIKIWSIQTGECLQTLDQQDVVTSLLINTDKTLISGSRNGLIKILDTNNNYKLLNTLNNESSVCSLCLIPDNKLACGSINGLITIWDLNNYSKMISFQAFDDDEWISCLKLDNSGDKLMAGSRDGRIKIWCLKSFECLKLFDQHLGNICSLETTMSNELILSGSKDNFLKLWNIDSGICLKTIKFDLGAVTAIKFCKNNDLIIIGTGSINQTKNKILIYDLANEKVLRTIDKAHCKFVSQIELLSNGDLISSAGNGEIKFWTIFEHI